jgi:NAD+ kinase
VTRAMLITPEHHESASHAVVVAAKAAREAGVQLVGTPDEREKHGEVATDMERVADGERPDVCLVLGGDGSILYALRRFAHTRVPVFAINFGSVGFLAAVERDQLEDGLRRAFTGDYAVMDLPALRADLPVERPIAVNDVSINRRPHGRVAELSYAIGGEEVGKVRCDGLVAATPAGSTGYNLANNGPILAWGVEGYVVSFIAPHTLTARALVVAPGDVLHVTNVGEIDEVDVGVDGVEAGPLRPGQEVRVGFRDGMTLLAQLEGENFYRRLREKFGRLAH